MLSPGEGVLTPGAVQAIGPGTVHSLNKQYGGSRAASLGQSNGRGTPGRQRRARAAVTACGSASTCSVLRRRDLRRRRQFLHRLGHDLLSGAKFASEFALNPVGTVESILGKVVSTTAEGDLGKIMTGIPMALIEDLAQLHLFVRVERARR